MKKLNGLWIGRLAEANAWYHIYPFAASKYSEHLYIVRHKELEHNIPNSSYHNYKPTSKKADIVKLFLYGIKVLRKNKIDYIMCFSMVPWGIVGWLLSKLTRKPFYIGLIGADFNKFYQRSSFKPIVRRMVKSSGIITVTGSTMEREIIETGIDKSKLFIFPHCVSDNYFTEEPDNTFDTDLITASSIIERKQIHLTIEALSILKKKNKCYTLKILGEGPLLEMLKELVNNLHLNDQVKFLGYTTDVFSHLRKSKVYVQASKSEGLSLSLIESMVAGNIPVSTVAGSEKDIINDGENGFLVEGQTAENLALAIEKALDPKNFEKIRKNVINSRDKFRIGNAIEFSEKIHEFIYNRYLKK